MTSVPLDPVLVVGPTHTSLTTDGSEQIIVPRGSLTAPPPSRPIGACRSPSWQPDIIIKHGSQSTTPPRRSCRPRLMHTPTVRLGWTRSTASRHIHGERFAGSVSSMTATTDSIVFECAYRVPAWVDAAPVPPAASGAPEEAPRRLGDREERLGRGHHSRRPRTAQEPRSPHRAPYAGVLPGARAGPGAPRSVPDQLGAQHPGHRRTARQLIVATDHL